MTGFLLDTNVVSELRKGAAANRGVREWVEKAADDELFISVLMLGEIRKGIEMVRLSDFQKAEALERWLRDTEEGFENRILPITAAIADQWGRFNAARPISTVDGLMAATALVHGMTFVTRNIPDVARAGVSVLNPFMPQ